MARDVFVVQTGTANTASVLAGLKRAGAQPQLTNDPDLVRQADRVVLPGVGALAAAMKQLEADGLTDSLRQRVTGGRPTLAICLGLQLLGTTSEESPGSRGLGLLDVAVKRFPEGVTVPQMGWNQVAPEAACRYVQPGYAYFANSFRLPLAPEGWPAAWTDHGGPFVAAMEKGDVLACQFHPELSGLWGQDLLQSWIEGRPRGGAAC